MGFHPNSVPDSGGDLHRRVAFGGIFLHHFVALMSTSLHPFFEMPSVHIETANQTLFSDFLKILPAQKSGEMKLLGDGPTGGTPINICNR